MSFLPYYFLVSKNLIHDEHVHFVTFRVKVFDFIKLRCVQLQLNMCWGYQKIYRLVSTASQ
jgi:hypothetical protein